MLVEPLPTLNNDFLASRGSSDSSERSPRGVRFLAKAPNDDVRLHTGPFHESSSNSACAVPMRMGVTAIRTHLNSNRIQYRNAWSAFRQMRDQWAGLIDLQATSLLQLPEMVGDFGTEIADLVAEAGGNLGVAISMTAEDHAHIADRFAGWLNHMLSLAEERGLDLDFHVDENGDAGARGLHAVAETALRRGFKGQILCGHCCSLAVHLTT